MKGQSYNSYKHKRSLLTKWGHSSENGLHYHGLHFPCGVIIRISTRQTNWKNHNEILGILGIVSGLQSIRFCVQS